MYQKLLLTIILVALAGCAEQRLQQAYSQAQSIVTDCKQKYKAGTFKTAVEEVQCEESYRDIMLQGGYPYPDLLDSMLETKMEIAEKLDKKKISKSKAKELHDNLITRIAQEESSRKRAANLANYEDQQIKSQRALNALNILNQQQQLQNQQEQLNLLKMQALTPPRTSMNCTSNVLSRGVVSTNCY